MVRENGITSTDVEEVTKEVEKEDSITYALHSDERETLVEIEGDLFKLVPTGKTIRELKKEKDHKNIPHVRRLNPIPRRSRDEQIQHNRDAADIHRLSQGGVKSDKVTLKKAMLSGENVEKEVLRLLEEKKKAQKLGDDKGARMIRRQLRSLDYKRYTKE